METTMKLSINRVFDRHPILKKAIHDGKDLNTHLETLAGLSGVNLNFLLINKDKVRSMAFTL